MKRGVRPRPDNTPLNWCCSDPKSSPSTLKDTAASLRVETTVEGKPASCRYRSQQRLSERNCLSAHHCLSSTAAASLAGEAATIGVDASMEYLPRRTVASLGLWLGQHVGRHRQAQSFDVILAEAASQGRDLHFVNDVQVVAHLVAHVALAALDEDSSLLPGQWVDLVHVACAASVALEPQLHSVHARR